MENPKDKKKDLPFIGDFADQNDRQSPIEEEPREERHNPFADLDAASAEEEHDATEEQAPDSKKRSLADIFGAAEKKEAKQVRNLDDVFSGAAAREAEEAQRADTSACDRLKEKNSTFVFVYGASQSGKSCFLVSLLSHLSRDLEGRLVARNKSDNRDTYLLYEDMLENFESGLLPDPTDVNKENPVYELDFEYTPAENAKAPARFTFLEMSGENLEHIDLKKTASGRLPDKIDAYLECPGVNLCFIMIIPHDAPETGETTWTKIDGNALNFIDYIKEKNPAFDNANLLFVVSKWDSYQGDAENATEFVKKHMGRTFSQLHHRGNQVTAYSIGDVQRFAVGDIERSPNVPDAIKRLVARKRVEEIDFILPGTVNHNNPEKVKRWLYTAVTGKVLGGAKPWWEKLFEWM